MKSLCDFTAAALETSTVLSGTTSILSAKSHLLRGLRKWVKQTVVNRVWPDNLTVCKLLVGDRERRRSVESAALTNIPRVSAELFRTKTRYKDVSALKTCVSYTKCLKDVVLKQKKL